MARLVCNKAGAWLLEAHRRSWYQSRRLCPFNAASRDAGGRSLAHLAMYGASMSERSLNAAYYRGGTSRAIIFERRHLPTREQSWPQIFLKLLGSPDVYGRQLDGLGVGVSSLSKVCIVAPSLRDDADVDYTFAAVGIRSSEVDFSGNCGNMSSAIGPFAINNGLVKAQPREDGRTLVRIHNTNTGKLIHATFPVTLDGEAASEGNCEIAGVSGTGAPITLAFLDPAGSKTGKLLPTGNVVDVLDGTEASCVDAANPCVFVRASDLGFDGYALPDNILKDAALLARLEELRTLGARAMGMCGANENAPRAIPKIAMLSIPRTHKVLSGAYLDSQAVDVVARVMSDRQPHRATPLTAALCLGVAGSIEGSVVDLMVKASGRPRVGDGVLTVGHSSGKIEVGAQLDKDGQVVSATVLRTARRLFEGKVYL